MLDRDRDSIITKEEVLEFLDFERGNTKIFPSNVVRAVQLYEEPSSGQISIEEFYKMARQIKYLVYPAHRLQDKLRDELLGQSFWEDLEMKIQERALEEMVMKKREALHKRMDTKFVNNPIMNSILLDKNGKENEAEDLDLKLYISYSNHYSHQ